MYVALFRTSSVTFADLASIQAHFLSLIPQLVPRRGVESLYKPLKRKWGRMNRLFPFPFALLFLDYMVWKIELEM